MILSLRVASFRGVRFQVESAALTFARRYKLHEFPGRDEPFIEDLGKGPKTYPVEGYLVGRDYALSRDSLITACAKDGAGKLIHPYHGMVDVRCLKFSVEETFRDGDYAKIRFEFIEAPLRPFGVPAIDKALDLIAKADKVVTESAQELAEAAIIVGMPAFIARSAEAVLDKACAFMTSANGLGVFSQATRDFAAAVADIRRDARDLIRSPLQLTSSMFSAFTYLARASGVTESVETVFSVVRKLKTLPLPDPRTALRKRERANHLAFVRATHEIAIGAAARLIGSEAGVVPAQATRTNGSMVMDEARGAKASAVRDGVFLALSDLEGALSRIIEEAQSKRQMKVETAKPALVIAYELYGDIAREKEIVSEHAVPDPGFVPRGTLIEARS